MNENYDKEFATYLLDLMKKEFKKELNKTQFLDSDSGVVMAIGSGTLDVKLAGSEEVLLGLKNKIDTDVTVNIGDEVIVVKLKGSLTNCFVAWKK